jgi:hypothetical protein
MNSPRFAVGTTVLSFILLFLLLPVSYTYSTPWSCPDLSGIYSCPPAVNDNNSKTHSISYANGPLITGVHSGYGFPKPVDKGKTILRDSIIAFIVGLITYRVTARRRQFKKHSRK